MIREVIAKVVSGHNLTESEIKKTFAFIMTGKATSAQIAAFITALRLKGETVDEITGAAKAMRSVALKLWSDDDYPDEMGTVLDTCGTGGDGADTFNISTATAFVAAGGGVTVAKHGNRAVSSRCGSADVLEALRVNLNINPYDVKRCIKEVGIGFLFAPLFHRAMQHATGARREIGIRTIFNILGPLTNPAGANVQILGVYDPSLTEKIARVLNRLGIREAFVVCGEGGYDEISICGPTRISHLKGNDVDTFEIIPEDFGIKRVAPGDIAGGDINENARIINEILDGQEGPKRDVVLLNTAAAFVVAGLDPDLKHGMDRAKDSIDTGRAREKLASLIEFTQMCSPAQ